MSERFLSGRVALVTGGASGMGRAMAMAFARAGARVAIGSLLSDRATTPTDGELVYMPGRGELDATAKEIESCDVLCFAAGLDVTRDESVDSFYQAAVERLGPVDILANAAGITAEQSICGHPDLLWHKVIDVNLNGTYRAIKRCLPGMIERKWGRIVNIASTAASVGAPTSGAYCASKAAVVGLTKAVALEGAPHGVTCNAISPGWVETRFGTQWMGHIAETAEGRPGSEYIAEVKAQNPQRRMIQPAEIGAMAAFLCRDDALGITMQDLTISAGSLW
jgi:3-hydroxybutyrate dehydrogenase